MKALEKKLHDMSNTDLARLISKRIQGSVSVENHSMWDGSFNVLHSSESSGAWGKGEINRLPTPVGNMDASDVRSFLWGMHAALQMKKKD